MVSPSIAKTLSPLGQVIKPLGTFVERAFTAPGSGAETPSITLPSPPPLAPEASTPTAKPKRKGQQQSFLSGVAASALGGQAGSSSGKTLLGS